MPIEEDELESRRCEKYNLNRYEYSYRAVLNEVGSFFAQDILIPLGVRSKLIMVSSIFS